MSKVSILSLALAATVFGIVACPNSPEPTPTPVNSEDIPRERTLIVVMGGDDGQYGDWQRAWNTMRPMTR